MGWKNAVAGAAWEPLFFFYRNGIDGYIKGIVAKATVGVDIFFWRGWGWWLYLCKEAAAPLISSKSTPLSPTRRALNLDTARPTPRHPSCYFNLCGRSVPCLFPPSLCLHWLRPRVLCHQCRIPFLHAMSSRSYSSSTWFTSNTCTSYCPTMC